MKSFYSFIRKDQILNYLFLAFVGVGFFCSCGRDKKDTERTMDKPKIEVALPIVKDSVIIYDSYPATLESQSSADVVARVNGQILKKHFENGSYVSKGQVLFTIESTTYASAVTEARAQVNSALGQLDYADKHLTALEQAFDANAVSEMDVIQARSAKSQAQASVNQAKAALSNASVKLGYCTVTAPVSGRITDATLDVGAYVNGEGSPVTLATIYDEKSLEVQFTIPDYEYASISSKGNGFNDEVYKNIPVYITTSEEIASDSPMFKAELSYQAPSVDASSGNILLKAKLRDNSETLRPGMYGRVMLPVGNMNQAILINDASISTDQRGKYVYVVNDSNKVVYTPIEIGNLYQDSLRIVKRGLSQEDRYVTKAMISVRNGETVIPFDPKGKVTKQTK